MNAYMAKGVQSVTPDSFQRNKKDLAFFWIDLYQPTKDEIESVENYYGVKFPTTHMQIGNVINRFFQDGHTCFMTLLTNENKNVVLILKEDTLITINNFKKTFLDPFKNNIATVSDAFVSVVEIFIQNIAEALETSEQMILRLSKTIKQYAKNEVIKRTRQTIEQKITASELNDIRELIVNNHNSLINLRLLINFSKKCIVQIPEQIGQSIDVLIDHTEFLNNKIAYLHNTVFDYLAVTQYNLQSSFNIFSATFFLPALIMSFFSMNFSNIPFLQVKNSIFFFIFIVAIGTYIICVNLKQLQLS